MTDCFINQHLPFCSEKFIGPDGRQLNQYHLVCDKTTDCQSCKEKDLVPNISNIQQCIFERTRFRNKCVRQRSDCLDPGHAKAIEFEKDRFNKCKSQCRTMLDIIPLKTRLTAALKEARRQTDINEFDQAVIKLQDNITQMESELEKTHNDSLDSEFKKDIQQLISESRNTMKQMQNTIDTFDDTDPGSAADPSSEVTKKSKPKKRKSKKKKKKKTDDEDLLELLINTLSKRV